MGGWLDKEASGCVISPKRASILEALSKDQSRGFLVLPLYRPQRPTTHHCAILAFGQAPSHATAAGWPSHPLPVKVIELMMYERLNSAKDGFEVSVYDE